MAKQETKKNKIFDSKVFWIVISLLISLALWVYVTSSENDEVKQTVRGVRVELIGETVLRENRNLVVTDLSTNTVSIEISGPRRIVTALNSNNVTAQIDVSKLSQAAYASVTYTVNYPNGTDTSNITVNRKVPETVNFMVSKLGEKTVPVRGSFNGSTAAGYTAEQPVYEPVTVTLSGPENYLKDISYAWVSFGEGEISSTYSIETGFTLLDEEGNEADTTGIVCSTDIVTATIPILETKELMLSVNLIEGAGATAENTKVTIVPESVTLAGDSAILNAMNNLPVGTVDLREFKQSNTYTFPIAFDSELKSLTGETEAQVTVEIVGLSTKTFIVSDLQFTNLTAGYMADIVSNSLEVVIRGTEEQLEQIDSANIRAVADLTDYEITTGSINPTVKISVDGVPDVGAVGEYTINLEIKKE